MTQHFVIYTDGACSPNPGQSAWGAVILSSQMHELKRASGSLGHGTNQTAEISAALEALKLVPAGSSVKLVSDSQYVLKGISEWRQGWIKRGWRNANHDPIANKELWVQLFAVVDSLKVTTEWVKGHNGDHFNEICDELATGAIERPNKSDNDVVKVSSKDRLKEAVTLIEAFLADQDTLNTPYRNEAICERANTFLEELKPTPKNMPRI